MAGLRRGSGKTGYRRARLLLLIAGLAVLVLIAILTYVRRVEPVEVTATLLFIPVFVAVVFWGAAGGLIAGAAAAIGYFLLRLPAIEAVGSERFIGLIASRTAAFLVFGGVAGWAAGRLERSILKLDLYDHIDDETQLHNARFFLEETDLEASRSKRYRSVFSVCVVDVPDEPISGLGRRKARRLLRDLGNGIASGIRSVDRGVHSRDEGRHRFAVILPETGREGAQVFTGRFVTQLAGRLAERGINLKESDLSAAIATVPDEEAALTKIREEFAAVARAEHPATTT